ncbi:MAG: peptidase A24 [Methanoregula sp.]|jgi:preflagellin peptidase FlaK|nr:peptidase A24 [Methanoregula sp.]
MEIFWPLAISATAVLVTLIYTSYLDARDRRVPFVHWMPMIAVGIGCTGVFLWQMTANVSLIAGYLAIVASFIYADYLDNRGRTDSLYLTWYYRKNAIFYYLALVLALPAISWFVLAPVFTTQMVAWYAMFAGIFSYVSYMEYQGRFEEQAPVRGKPQRDTMAGIIGRWYFVLIVMILGITSILMMVTQGGWGTSAYMILFLSVFCGAFYIFGRMHLFGGADAWALIFIAFAVPTFPITPVLGIPPLGFLAFSTLINALLLNLAAPLAIFAINIARGNKAPIMYLFFGFPVKGESIQKEWGFVMEDFEENDGVVSRKFIGFWDAIRRMYRSEGRVYTKDLREHPGEFKEELAMYRKAGTVWISYAVPFIIPITAGFITAVIFGDFLLALMNFFV